MNRGRLALLVLSLILLGTGSCGSSTSNTCRVGADGTCPAGMTCKLIVGLACSSLDPDCNGWHCISTDAGP